MSPYSGLVDMAEKAGLLVKEGNKLLYKGSAKEYKYFRKAWEGNEDGCLDAVMADYGTPKVGGEPSPESTTESVVDKPVEKTVAKNTKPTTSE